MLLVLFQRKALTPTIETQLKAPIPIHTPTRTSPALDTNYSHAPTSITTSSSSSSVLSAEGTNYSNTPTPPDSSTPPDSAQGTNYSHAPTSSTPVQRSNSSHTRSSNSSSSLRNLLLNKTIINELM